jgi:hypothetical protein
METSIQKEVFLKAPSGRPRTTNPNPIYIFIASSEHIASKIKYCVEALDQ